MKSRDLPLFLALSALAIGFSASAAVFTTNTTIYSWDQTYEGQDLVASNCTLTIDGYHSFSSMRIAGIGMLTHSLTSSPPTGMDIEISGDLKVEAGASIRVDGRGVCAPYLLGSGTSNGGPPSGGGGGHGGYGGNSSSNGLGGIVYDSLLEPREPGSCGGHGISPGGAGGGAIRLRVVGELQLDGVISARGENGVASRSGGGSGGSIWITAQRLRGAGSIAADGGSGEPIHGGGGGGGRVAIYFSTNHWSGSVTASGGKGFVNGGAGTIYVQALDFSIAEARVDNKGQTGTNTPVSLVNQADLTITGGAKVVPQGNISVRNLLIEGGAWIVSTNSILSTTLTASNAFIQAGCGVNFDLGGYSARLGPGAGVLAISNSVASGGGGGHAGHGGTGSNPAAYGGNVYGELAAPNTPGSGGALQGAGMGSAGGGALQLFVAEALVLDGSISANGGQALSPNAGGGAGGSIYITAKTFSGTGKISAQGGEGALPGGGGGGGGRIAISYNTNTFSGTTFATGGRGANNGGAGTIYLRPLTGNPRLVVDNGGLGGTNTPVDVPNLSSLEVKGGARAELSGIYQPSFSDLIIRSNSILYPARLSRGQTTVRSNLYVEATGKISADGRGQLPGPGQMSGRYASSGGISAGGGGGHSGYGGAGSVAGATGGLPASWSYQQPLEGGGGGANPVSTGGVGGGIIYISVLGAATIQGDISANGTSASGSNAGGGAGGGIYLSTPYLAGGGRILAHGGNGWLPNGGGGSGGRIRIAIASRGTNAFVGSITAYGGAGTNAGAAGSISLTDPSAGTNIVVIDAGGLAGALSTLSDPAADTIVRNGAKLLLSSYSYTAVKSLLVQSNSGVYGGGGYYNYSLALNVTSDLVVEAGGRLDADGTGSAVNAGSGRGVYVSGSAGGGGYGGAGGMGGHPAAFGGMAYGTITSVAAGSGGGSSSSDTNYGGAGGGLIQLTAGKRAHIDGVISARGSSAKAAGRGGGSGGGISIKAQTLSGTGEISADGGHGISPSSGGGGGGRILVNCATNLFAGRFSTAGGTGAATGGAGAVYFDNASGNAVRRLVIDNGGIISSTNTPVKDSLTYALEIAQGAVAYIDGVRSLNSLSVKSNSWLTMSNANLTLGSAVIHEGAGVIATGLGYGPAAGPGAGNSIGLQKGGGGHGGTGGSSLAGFGLAYGSVSNPSFAGSGGGNGSGANGSPRGGAGGGVIRLLVIGMLTLDGNIAANGAPGNSDSGGGAGGSVWISAGNIAGKGQITADGGNGTGLGGGGAGGRIATLFRAGEFNGTVSATGGGGFQPGGAGTVFMRDMMGKGDHLVLANRGQVGAPTPLLSGFGLPTSTFNLSIKDGAIAHWSHHPLSISNAWILNGGQLSSPMTQSNLEFVVLRDLTVGQGGSIDLNERGHLKGAGEGAGGASQGQGGGAGHGGFGGQSANHAPGGSTYGSPLEPATPGSGGGPGNGPAYNDAAGGGVIRLMVGGALIADGRISANGAAGVQDDSGGGAGGSIWINADALRGEGTISADGGWGELFSGGGGAGGRIAVYRRTNSFNGVFSAAGGWGATPGEDGSLFSSGRGKGPVVISQDPSGLTNDAVGRIELTFDSPLSKDSITTSDVRVQTPSETLQPGEMSAISWSPTKLTIEFFPRTTPGRYTVQVGPSISDIWGQPMPQMYTGTFDVVLPAVIGKITDTNGLPVAGAAIQFSDGQQIPVYTDAEGVFTRTVGNNWAGTVTPSLGSAMFIPGSRTLSNVTANVEGLDFLMVPTIEPTLTCTATTEGMSIQWQGWAGVNYRLESSTNFLHWVPYGNPIPGSNGSMNLVLPLGAQGMRFYRVLATN